MILKQFLKECEQNHIQLSILDNTLTGIEKENLRITKTGHIAKTMHPSSLGASLTHPFITTDYSESLLEMVTPPINSATGLLSWLENLHIYVYQHLGQELLWAPSMPCAIDSPDDVTIAQYGKSHSGRMRTLYRIGLGHRYEKKMQTIAGIHLNYSLPRSFWEFWHERYAPQQDLQTTIDHAYFAILRNYLRYGWLIDYLFGASSAFDRSFLSNTPPPDLKTYKKETLYAPYACSLRMSDLGYHNKTQKELNISFNSVQEYAQGLIHAINTHYPIYQTIFDKYGKDSQINANLLQIEAEYYAPIRPKRVVEKSKRISQALLNKGVEYLEVRAIDINPYEPLGINLQQIYFVELFLLYCLLTDSPNFKQEDYMRSTYNTQTVVLEGRKPGCQLQHHSTQKSILLSQWAQDIFKDLYLIADMLDAHTHNQRYTRALHYYEEKITHPELLPSAQLLEDLFNHHNSFTELGLALSDKNKDYFMNKQLTELERADFDQLTEESLQQLRLLEAQQTGSFEQFIAAYFT